MTPEEQTRYRGARALHGALGGDLREGDDRDLDDRAADELVHLEYEQRETLRAALDLLLGILDGIGES